LTLWRTPGTLSLIDVDCYPKQVDAHRPSRFPLSDFMLQTRSRLLAWRAQVAVPPFATLLEAFLVMGATIGIFALHKRWVYTHFSTDGLPTSSVPQTRYSEIRRRSAD